MVPGGDGSGQHVGGDDPPGGDLVGQAGGDPLGLAADDLRGFRPGEAVDEEHQRQPQHQQGAEGDGHRGQDEALTHGRRRPSRSRSGTPRPAGW